MWVLVALLPSGMPGSNLHHSSLQHRLGLADVLWGLHFWLVSRLCHFHRLLTAMFNSHRGPCWRVTNSLYCIIIQLPAEQMSHHFMYCSINVNHYRCISTLQQVQYTYNVINVLVGDVCDQLESISHRTSWDCIALLECTGNIAQLIGLVGFTQQSYTATHYSFHKRKKRQRKYTSNFARRRCNR